MIINSYNIISDTAVTLVDSTTGIMPSSILFTNVHGSDASLIDLYITDTTNSYYVIKNVNLPAGASMQMGKSDYNFDTEKYSLLTKVHSGGNTVDVLIKF